MSITNHQPPIHPRTGSVPVAGRCNLCTPTKLKWSFHLISCHTCPQLPQTKSQSDPPQTHYPPSRTAYSDTHAFPSSEHRDNSRIRPWPPSLYPHNTDRDKVEPRAWPYVPRDLLWRRQGWIDRSSIWCLCFGCICWRIVSWLWLLFRLRLRVLLRSCLHLWGVGEWIL